MSTRAHTTARRLAQLALGALVASLALTACEPELGELPATCDASAGAEACPEGYECIQGVCAAPGTALPITLATLQYLRGIDLRLVPLESGALAVWQVYDYDLEEHDFVAARLDASGTASAQMTLVGSYPSNANYLEPYFDVLATGPTSVQISIGAAPFDDAPESRLDHYAVSLPPAGREADGATSEQRWSLRLRTLGYGAVSRPRLQLRDDGVELAYFESLVSDLATLGELSVFQLDASGDRKAAPTCTTPDCCQADTCTPARAGSTVAIGVVDSFRVADSTYWVLDETRPSFLRRPDEATGVYAEGELPRLAVPVAAEAGALVYVQPSPRAGEGLATDPVSGNATLWRVPIDASGTPGTAQALGELPSLRDTPRPVWIAREGKPALLVTPGAELAAPTIRVYAIEAGAGATLVAEVERYSSVPVAAVQASLVAGKLYLAWVDEQTDSATIRAAVIDEP